MRTKNKITSKTILQIIKQGGATFNKYGKNARLKNGYQVSVQDCAILDLANINNIITTANKLLDNIPQDTFLGFWVDGDKIYIDYSKNYNSKLYALTIGNIYNQIAIFDIKNNCSIFCDTLKTARATA